MPEAGQYCGKLEALWALLEATAWGHCGSLRALQRAGELCRLLGNGNTLGCTVGGSAVNNMIYSALAS